MSHSRSDKVPAQRPVKFLHTDWHLHRVEWILHNIIPVDLIAPPDNHIRIGLLRAREQQKLDTCWRLKASQSKVTAFQALNSSCRRLSIARYVLRGWNWSNGAADGVNAVECTSEDEVVVAVELLQAWCEGAVVDEAAGFVDDEEGEDDPRLNQYGSAIVVLHVFLT